MIKTSIVCLAAFIILFNTKLSAQNSPETWDTQFGPFSSFNGVGNTIRAFAIKENELIAGGDFTVAGGVSASRIAIYNPKLNQWRSLGNGVNGRVNALLVFEDEVYVGGNFTSAGVEATNIAAYHFKTQTWRSVAQGVNGEVRALAVVGNEIIVGGDFTIAGGISANHIAKYNPVTNDWGAFGVGLNNSVRSILTHNDELIVGGAFTSAGGEIANFIARFNLTTNTWAQVEGGTNGSVNTLSTIENGFLAGGEFTQVGDMDANHIARFNFITNQWNSFGTGTNGSVNSIAVSEGEFFVGGNFTIAGDVPANRVARYNLTFQSWLALESATGDGLNNNVFAIALLQGDLFSGGGFVVANVGNEGITANRIAKFNLTQNNWRAVVVSNGNGVNGAVLATAIFRDSVLIVGGEFTQVGGVSTNGIALFNLQTNTWSTFGLGANATVNSIVIVGQEAIVGGAFTTIGNINANRIARYNFTTNTWSALGGGVNSDVLSIASLGNEIFVGGQFTTVNGILVSRIARYNLQTGEWSRLGVGTNGPVLSVTVASNQVIIAGFFTVVGESVVANRAARFNLATNTWSDLSGGLNNNVNVVYGFGSDVYVGGLFSQAGSQSISFLAKFNLTTNSWSSVGGGVNGQINSISSLGNELMIGGFFSVAGEQSASNVVRYNPLTNVWRPLGSGVNSVVRSFAQTPSSLFVGGGFTIAGGVSSNRIGRYFLDPSSVSNSQVVSTNGTVSFAGSGVRINFAGVSGSGFCTVQRFDFPANNIQFSALEPTFQSRYHFRISTTGFSFSTALLRFDRSEIPNSGIVNAQSVFVYRRSTPGSGSFSVLPNAFNPAFPNEVRATTPSFSEFILGSDEPSNQLPVEFIEFIAQKVASGVFLSWKTASEFNNAGFELERKSSNEAWHSIGFVQGVGTTTETQAYTFHDKTASGILQYRLKQVDFDGKFEYSTIVEIDAGLPTKFELSQNYPNPFNPTTRINYQLPVDSHVRLDVYDMLGKKVVTLVNQPQPAGSYSFAFVASNFSLSSGLYFYRLQAGAPGTAPFLQTKKMLLVK